MANVYGTNYTAAFNTVPPEMVGVGAWGGRVRCMMDTYEANGLASGDFVYIGKMNKGFRLLPNSFIQTDALGASAYVAIGNPASADAYRASVLANTADAQLTLSKIDAAGVAFSVDTDITIKLLQASATGTIKSYLFYTID